MSGITNHRNINISQTAAGVVESSLKRRRDFSTAAASIAPLRISVSPRGEHRTVRDRSNRFRSERRRMPYHKFYPHYYRSLSDITGDGDNSNDLDEVASFSSLKLAKDQDKPTNWRKKTDLRGKRTTTKPRKSSVHPASVISDASSMSSILDYARPSEQKPLGTVGGRAFGVSELHGTSASSRPSVFLEQREPATNVDTTSFNQRRKEAKKRSDGVSSCFLSPFDPLPHDLEQQNKRVDVSRVPEMLPSPKENCHPQTKLFSLCTGANIGEDEGTTDARVALVPSPALNLIQCWRNSSPHPDQQKRVAVKNMEVKPGTKDPLLVALQVVRLKRELKKLRIDSDHSRTLQHTSKSISDLPEPTRPTKKCVRFAERLVTEVRERPFTEPEEMDQLYFVNGELEELEWDRSTVELDQFECIIQNESNTTEGTFVEVSHNSRRLHSIGDEGLPHSISDLSFY